MGLKFFGDQAVIFFFRDRDGAERFLKVARRLSGRIVCYDELLRLAGRIFKEDGGRAVRALLAVSDVERFRPEVSAFIGEDREGLRSFLLWSMKCFRLLGVPEAPERFLEVLNFLLLKDSLARAERIAFEYLGESAGTFFKWAVYLSKKLGAAARIEGRRLECGGGWAGAGLVSLLASRLDRWVISAEYWGRKFRPKLVLRSWSPWTPKFGSPSEPLFDSLVERVVYEALADIGARVLREPVVIEAGGTFFVPDFSVKYLGRTFLVEVVGFWREDYLLKKKELAKLQDVVIVADRRVCDLFPGAVCYSYPPDKEEIKESLRRALLTRIQS